MSNEEIDRALSDQDEIAPSSGFASLVMDAVRRDVEIPPPIPFPWKLALLGLIPSGVLLLIVIVVFVRLPSAAEPIRIPALRPETDWIVVGVLAALVSIAVSLRIAGRRA